MNKKTSLKVLAAATVLSSAYISSAPVEAAQQNQSVEQLVKEAEHQAWLLKWAISVEGTNESLSHIPWDHYNNTKAAYKKAKEAVQKLSGKQKVLYETRLQEKVELYISTAPGKIGRAVAYIDAVNAGKKIEAKRKQLEAKLAENNIDNQTEKAYHELSREIKKQSVLIDRVYGYTTRQAMRAHYKKTAEKVILDAMYPVSIKMYLDKAEKALTDKNLNDASKYLNILDKLMQEGQEKGLLSSEAEIFTNLDVEIRGAKKQYGETWPTAPSNPPVDPVPTPEPTPTPEDNQSLYNEPGTYGPATGLREVNTNITVSSDDVILRNMVINGDLIIDEAVGEGEVTLQNVTVTGTTYVRGGGTNSIFFEDSVLATVIVNKNNGAVRIVASGATQVVEVQLESYGRIVEENLDEGSEGFTNVEVNPTVQTVDSNLTIDLVGSFETINSRATQVRINLPATTDIRTLILNAAASVLGEGRINTAEINADGSTISRMPQNVALNNGTTVMVGEEEVTESHSEVQQTALKEVKLTQGSIFINTNDYVAGLTEDDFELIAKLDGEPITLTNVNYLPEVKRLSFDAIPLSSENLGKVLTVEVKPASGSEKLTGTSQTVETSIQHGFEGRITDVAGVGMEGVVIKFREGSNIENEIIETAVTDKYGYYSVALPEGEYTGEFSGPSVVTSYMYATSASDVYLKNQNETAIRAAATNEVKIMLSWGEEPSDLDSHLIGETIDGTDLHTWYSEKLFEKDGTTYVDLDWDDTDSYGPETTTIRRLKDGKYVFYVHNFSGETPMGHSGANVKIFKGNSATPVETLNIPVSGGEDLYWVAFEINISNNGENVDVKKIDKSGNWQLPEFFLDPIGKLTEQIETAEEIISATQNPSQELADIIDALEVAKNQAKAVIDNNTYNSEQLLTVYQSLDASLGEYYIYQSKHRYEEMELGGFTVYHFGGYFINSRGLEPEGIEYEITPASSEVVSFERVFMADEDSIAVTAKQSGSETITVKATDVNGKTETITYYFTVVADDFKEDENLHLVVGDVRTFDLDNLFNEMFGLDADTIEYSIRQQDESVVEMDLDLTSSELSVTSLSEGFDAITINGTDADGRRGELKFFIHVSAETVALTTEYFDTDENGVLSATDTLLFTAGEIAPEHPVTVNIIVDETNEANIVEIYDFEDNVLYSLATPGKLTDKSFSSKGTLGISEEDPTKLILTFEDIPE